MCKLDNIVDHLSRKPGMSADAHVVQTSAANLFNLFDVLIQIEQSQKPQENRS